MVRPLHTDRPRRVGPLPGEAAAPRRPRARVVAVLAGLAALSACGTPAPRPIQPEFDLRHPSATRRVEAVTATVSARDKAEVPALIQLLEDEDDAVRLSAGAALRDLTGHDTGYRAFASPEERTRQAAEWREWWGAHGAALPPASPPGKAVAPPPGTPPARTAP